MRFLLDTSVLVRSFVPSDQQHQTAVDAVTALRTRGDDPCLVPQNYYEFWVVSTRPTVNNGRGRTPAEVAAEFAYLDTKFVFLPDPPTLFDEWRRLVVAHGVTGKPAHDARLVAAMQVHGVTHVLTFNGQDFARYPGITVLDPRALAVPPPAPTPPPSASGS